MGEGAEGLAVSVKEKLGRRRGYFMGKSVRHHLLIIALEVDEEQE